MSRVSTGFVVLQIRTSQHFQFLEEVVAFIPVPSILRSWSLTPRLLTTQCAEVWPTAN